MFIKVFSPLIFLLGLLDVTNAQFGRCDYKRVIAVGELAYAFTDGYPIRNYSPGTTCRWIATSDRPINMTCNFQLPPSYGCNLDVAIIKSSNAPGTPYCGTGTFTIISQNNQIIIELYSSQGSPGGNFICSLQTMTSISDEACTCGSKKPTKIVGGNDTDVNEYPMMAGLVDTEKQIIFCGATIINPKQVLTAAHCVYKRDYRTIGVVVGEHDTRVGNETEATELLEASGYDIFPQYSGNAEDYDIAIVTVDGEITFNELVGPACLPFQHSQDSFAGDYVNILGWGSIDFGERQSNTLQVAQVHITTNRECSNSYSRITTRQMCTEEEGKDSCQFDSGGPVLWINPTTKNVVLVAIISYGVGCASRSPAVNTRVGAFIDWVLLRAPPGFKYCQVE